MEATPFTITGAKNDGKSIVVVLDRQQGAGYRILRHLSACVSIDEQE
jgi:hypothetical protein